MAFMGILLINAILTILLVIVGLFLLSLLIFIVFMILSAKDKQSKWKKIIKITSGVFAVLFFIPLLLLGILFFGGKTQTVKYNEKTYKLDQKLVEDFFYDVEHCDIPAIDEYLDKNPALLYSHKRFNTENALGKAIESENLSCVQYFAEYQKMDINYVSSDNKRGALELAFIDYSPEVINYLLDQDGIDVNKCYNESINYYYVDAVTIDKDIEEEEINILNKMLDKGLDTKAKDYDGKNLYELVNDSKYDDVDNIESLRTIVKNYK